MMETHKEKSVPNVKDFQNQQMGWAPVTPSKPQVPHFAPVYDFDESEMELFLSNFSSQNQVSQQYQGYSSCIPSSRSNNPLWDAGLGGSSSSNSPLWDASLGGTGIGNFDVQQRDSNGNVAELHKRGLEDYLPRLNSQGRRSKVVCYSSDQLSQQPLSQPFPQAEAPLGQIDFPYFRSWEASQSIQRKNNVSVLGSGEDPLSVSTSFTDLLGVKVGMENAAYNPGWNASHSANNSRFNGCSSLFNRNESNPINQTMRDIFGEEMQNCDSLPQYQGVCNVNTQTNTNARTSNFSPATPDSRWRIESRGSENTPLGANNQAPTEHNEFQEQDVAAAMINLQNVAPNTDSSTPDKVSMTVENHDPEKGGEQVVDLNKTPQKKTRRRRYQPKVLSEKKPAKTPKPKTPSPTETKANPGVTRKYARKKKVDNNTAPATPPKEANEAAETKPTRVDEVGTTKPAETTTKSCRKSLHFDLSGGAAEINLPHMSNGDAHGKAQGKCDPERNQLNCTDNHVKRVEVVVEASRGGIAFDLNCTYDQELENYLSLHTKDYPNSSQPDPNIPKRKENIPHTLSGNNTVIQSRSEAPHLAQNPNSSPCASSCEQKNRRGSKRSKSSIGDSDAGIVGTFSQPNLMFFGNANIGELQNFLLPEFCKRKRTEKVQKSHLPSTSICDPVGDINQVANAQTHPKVDPSASKYYCCNPSPSETNAVTNNNHTHVLVESIQNNMQLVNTWADLARLKKKRSKGTIRVRDPAQLMGIASVQPKKPGPKGPRNKKIDSAKDADTEALAVCSTAKPKPKRRSKKQNSENKLDLVLYNGSIPALTWTRSTSCVEEITEWMKHLDISKESCNTELRERIKEEILQEQKNLLQQPMNALVPYRAHKQEQNALVVYGRDGTMVPFEGPFNHVKKRRQRAKVDLDDETTKVWNLLLENINNEGIDGTDEDKAKWWENERSVFRGRVDSFIARMRLVQGDRRFTPWKGSVLDSVIGVFLTQNVSDHLSSSAFMSMASHFPLKSEGSESTLSEESATALVEEPDICVYEPEEVVNSKELMRRAPGSVSPKVYSRKSRQKIPSSIVSNANSPTSEIETASILGDERSKDDATSSPQSVISSQNSTNSLNLQTVEKLSTFAKSDSISQPLTTSCQLNYLDYSTSFLGLLKMAERPFLHESYNQSQQDSLECMNHASKDFPEAQGTGSSNYLLNLCYPFPHTKGFETLEVVNKSPYAYTKDDNSTPLEQSNLTTNSMVQHLTQEKSSDSIPRSSTKNMSCFVLEGEEMVMHSLSVKEPLDTIASSPGMQTSSAWKATEFSQVIADVAESTTEFKRDHCDQKEVEQVPVPTQANASKSKRRQDGKGKNNTFDWDSLRREAQPNGQKKERPANTRDSLDWEAVRHADVSEIAEVIKERGMNNMLAERIKALLDRLVKEHGSVDMEWVRDIPPDKAKEYLLSFRGLGLKSVECVRLLTLHHLAFPVDTNVGRIAVRLGWVPLQPLPESLQLHLLELYPILESIQKYLWPRLCKLDQKTLYELHYHLITFGKVFCTKRQPNCNACPLRAECRHFASAFASARFALPGPEEKGIIPSGVSSSTHASFQASSNLLPLPPAFSSHYSQNKSRCVDSVPTVEVSPSSLLLSMPESISHLDWQSETNYCEPIVEVPASPEPEPEPEQIIYDIEDTFDEDPNEIPTISLNMKEFTQTVQNYIQNRDSNALVALTPEAASIPTPKLKNINRLRTEHHVYELPDTHPLIKGLDKREPDDPCSYLLAIWTPGETADSIQPPERRCNSEDPSILCNEVTCSYCNSLREANSQIVRGTLLIPCRTAMRGSFPLNGTYFQVNEVFADHDSSLSPIAVPRSWLWNLPRRTVYFGTSIPTIFKGLNTEEIQHCFWRGFVCVRGFDQRSRAPRPLMARLHFPASRMQKKGEKGRAYNE